jgi:hypothetical protein
MDPASRSTLPKLLRSRRFGVIFAAVIVLLSLLYLGHLIHSNWATLTAHSWQLDCAQLALTLVLHLCAYIIAIWAWHSMVKRLASAGDLRQNARIFCYSAVARRLPGAVWDIATRVVMYDSEGVSKAMVGLASLLEWIVIAVAGVVAYSALTPFTLPYLSELGSWARVGALASGIALIHPRLVTYVVRRLKEDALPVTLQYLDTLQWLLLYLVVWILGGLMLYATIRSIYSLPVSYLQQVIADWTLSGVLTSFITFLPAGVGLKEVTLTLLLSRYMPEYIAVVTSILVRLLTIAYSILWMLWSSRLQGLTTREGLQ